ncbi:MAG: nitrilase-related carbon-nitrogen hydrolase [Bacteroidota bacterium]
MKKYLSKFALPLILILFGVFFSSPKFNWSISVWLGTLASIYFFRQQKWWRALLILLLPYILVSFIANDGVIPFPQGPRFVLTIFLSLVGLLPFALDAWLAPRLPKWSGVLFLPACALVFNLLLSQGPTGAMGFMANTQVSIGLLMQWTAYIGIFGIGFLIYLSASVLYSLRERYLAKQGYAKGLLAFALGWAMILGFGAWRQYQGQQIIAQAPSVRVAALTYETTPLLSAMYEAETGQQKQFSRTLNQTDPELLAIGQSAILNFKDQAEAPQYQIVHEQSRQQFADILAQSESAVRQGAKILLTSEAEITTTKARESFFIEATQAFAREHEVYFFLGLASLLPDLQFPEHPFVENKILVVGPDGEILDTYYKNVPVEGADPSVPGDGKLDVIETPYGRLSYAICYDTDFPQLIRQAGQQAVEILLVPTGDWYALSPYHTLAGNIRAIENGFSQVRAVSNGLSSAVDAFGHYHATDDFFADEDHLMIVDVPIFHHPTFYSRWGDLVSPLSQLILLLCALVLLKNYLRQKWQRRDPKSSAKPA